MGFNNTSSCERLRNYEQAHAHFNRTPRPRQSAWADDERPLAADRQHHYRLVKGDGGEYYDMVLYYTAMARYYRPEADGSYRVCYTHDSRTASSSFMWDAVGAGMYPKFRATDGTERIVPIGGSREFGTDLWFNEQGKLVVERSTHAPMATEHASKKLSEWKTQLRRKLDPMICLMEIAVQDTLDAGEGSETYNAGRAFTTIPTTSNIDHNMRRWGEAGCPELNGHGIETLRDLYIICAKYIIDRRLTKAEERKWGYKKVTPYTAPKPSAVTTSVINYLAKYAPYSVTRKEYRPIEKFLTELPKSAVFI